jgi:endonuclease/exonuclease/phosphatase (EEP) superfamily protein YafD
MVKVNKHNVLSRTGLYLLNLTVLLMLSLSLLTIEVTSWWFDNLSSLQLQWILLALLLLIINIKRAEKILSTFILLLLTACIYQKSPLFSAGNGHPAAATLKIAQLNIHYQNQYIDPLLAKLGNANFDILVLQEVGDDQRDKITTLKQRYPYFISDSSLSDLAFFSKWPIVEQKTHYLGYKGSHIIEAIVHRPQTNSPVHIFALHPASPRNANLWQLRNSTLEYVAKQASASLLQYKMIIGDLNITPWSTQFKALQKNSLLRNSTNALAYIPSWSYSGRNPLLQLLSSAYIDHCLISDSFQVISKDNQKIQGSDHQLLVTELSMR